MGSKANKSQTAKQKQNIRETEGWEAACIWFAREGYGSGGTGGYRDVFCGELPEAFPMSDRANSSWLQDGPVPGQG